MAPLTHHLLDCALVLTKPTPPTAHSNTCIMTSPPHSLSVISSELSSVVFLLTSTHQNLLIMLHRSLKIILSAISTLCPLLSNLGFLLPKLQKCLNWSVDSKFSQPQSMPLLGPQTSSLKYNTKTEKSYIYKKIATPNQLPQCNSPTWQRFVWI